MVRFKMTMIPGIDDIIEEADEMMEGKHLPGFVTLLKNGKSVTVINMQHIVRIEAVAL